MAAKKKAVVPPQAKNMTPPSATGVPAKVPSGPANPALKGSARGIEKKAAGMAKRAANKPTLTGTALAATKKSAGRPTAPGVSNGKRAKKMAGPSVGSGKKGLYW